MNEYTLLLLGNDAELAERASSSLVTRDGFLIDASSRAWAQIQQATRQVITADGILVAYLVYGSGSAPMTKTLGAVRPLPSCKPQELQMLSQSTMSDDYRLAIQGQVWAAPNQQAQMVTSQGVHIADLIKTTGAKVAVFTPVQTRFLLSETAAAQTAAAAITSVVNSDGVVLTAEGVPWAQADSQGAVRDASGNVIGRLDPWQPSSSSKTLASQGYRIHDCPDPNLQNLLENVWIWERNSRLFYDNFGQVMAHAIRGSDQVQLIDLQIVGRIRAAVEKRDQVTSAPRPVIPENCIKRQNHSIVCDDDSLRERLERSVLNSDGLFYFYESMEGEGPVAITDTIIARLHRNQRHIIDRHFTVIAELIPDPTKPLPMNQAPETTEQRAERCIYELSRYNQFWVEGSDVESSNRTLAVVPDPGQDVGETKSSLVTIPEITIEPHPDLLNFVEKEGGIFDLRFDVKAWQKAMDGDKSPERPLVPLAYIRPNMEPQSSLVTAEIVRDYETILNVFRGKISGASFTFLFLDGLESVLDKKTQSNLGNYLNAFVNLECLGLRKAGIRRLDRLSLPRLNQFNISYNLITDTNALVNCVSALPSLQIFDFRENPLMSMKGFDRDLLPLSDHILWQTLLPKCRFLTHINGQLIDPARKSKAMALSKSKDVRAHRSWDVFLLALEQLPDMNTPIFEQEFNAESVRTLNLDAKGLSAVFMHRFVNVRQLNLHGNELTTMENSGFEKMQSLQDLDLSDNRLAKSRHYKNLNVLALLSRLQRLKLKGNKDLKNYRLEVIFLTRNLPGTNRNLGLGELDGNPITIEERVEAVATFGKQRDVVPTRWYLNMVHEFGHQQIATVERFESKILTLVLPGRCLDKLDVGKLVNLQILDISNNRLSQIDGLQNLSSLRCLDAAGNPSFRISSTLKQIKPFTMLERVAIARTSTDADSTHIRTLLHALLPNNRRLSILERKQIDFLDRMMCLQKIYKKNKNLDLERYRTNLAILQCATPLVGRDYSYEGSEPGQQYEPSTLHKIDHVSHLDIKSIDLSRFLNLIYLNISFNSLTALPTGLISLQKLEHLDLHANRINAPLKQIAEMVDKLGSLQVLHFRGNPLMRTSADRLKLIALVDRMKQVDCTLRVLDAPVSLDERVDSWLANGGPPEQAEALRYRAAIFQRVPKGLEPSKVLELDLSSNNISMLSLHGFINLRKLCLRSNRLGRLLGADIEKMINLRVLEMAHNQLSNLNEILSVISSLPELIYLTLYGNQLSDRYRAGLISGCVHFTRAHNKLIYVDNTEVTVGETLANIPDATEEFRFNLAVYRRTSPPLETITFENQAQIPNRYEVAQMDLSQLDLRFLDLSGFIALRSLQLSYNQIDTNALTQSGLASCKVLEHLYIDHNHLTTFQKIIPIFSKLKKLRVLEIIGNPCYPEMNKSDRHKLLKEWPDIERRSFALRFLDGVPVTVRERIKAASNLDSNLTEETRLDLTIQERQRLLPSGEPDLHLLSIDLSGSDLQLIKPCFQAFQMLQEINLDDNALRSLADQGLDTLVHLHCLRLRNNEFPSLDCLLEWLSLCHALKSVYLEQSTTDGRTKLVESYIDVVGFRLRGVATIDDERNSHILEGMQLEAQRFLWSVAKIGPNQCVDVDISNKNIAAELFFYIIAAFAELNCVARLKSSGNQWNRGDKRILNYRQYMIFGLGRSLQILDDEPISDDERRNAIDFVQKEDSARSGTGRVHKGGWIATKDKAMVQQHKLTAADARKNAAKGPELSDNKNLSNLPTSGGDDNAGLKATIGSAAQTAGASVQQIASYATAPLLQITGSVLVKFEIMINFLQMYSLIYMINIRIPWPRVWVNLSQYLMLFSINLDLFDIIMPIHWKDLAMVKYTAVLALPLLFIAIYHLGDSLDVESFRRRFVANWRSSKCKAATALLFWVIVSAGISVMVYPANFTQIKAMKVPDGNYNGLIVALVSPALALLTCWLFIAWRFRSNCLGSEPNKFLRWWYNRTYMLRRISLFALTILFLPVSRVIMQQFECDGDRLKIYRDRLCPREQLYPIQYTAFGFAVFYIVGLPFFFGRLISKATKMIDSHGYSDEAAVYHELIAGLKRQAKRDKQVRKKIQDAQEHLDMFYANEVMQNPVPQTYLYGPYQRRFRYFKLFQMFQKLAIVLLTIYVPDGWLFKNTKLILSNSMVISAAIIAIVFRPFQDKFESLLEILSQVANMANISTALLMDAGLPEVLGALILITFNGISWAAFLFTVLAAPIRALVANRKFMLQQRTLQETAKQIELQGEQLGVAHLPPPQIIKQTLQGVTAHLRHDSVISSAVAGSVQAAADHGLEAGQELLAFSQDHLPATKPMQELLSHAPPHGTESATDNASHLLQSTSENVPQQSSFQQAGDIAVALRSDLMVNSMAAGIAESNPAIHVGSLLQETSLPKAASAIAGAIPSFSSDQIQLSSSGAVGHMLQDAASVIVKAMPDEMPDFTALSSQTLQAAEQALPTAVSALQQIQLPTSESVKEAINDAVESASHLSASLQSSSASPLHTGASAAAEAVHSFQSEQMQLSSSEAIEDMVQSTASHIAEVMPNNADFIKTSMLIQALQTAVHALPTDASSLQQIQLPTSDSINEAISDAVQAPNSFHDQSGSVQSSAESLLHKAAKAATGGFTGQIHLPPSGTVQETIQSASSHISEAMPADLPDLVKTSTTQILQTAESVLPADAPSLQGLQLPTSDSIKEAISGAVEAANSVLDQSGSLQSSAESLLYKTARAATEDFTDQMHLLSSETFPQTIQNAASNIDQAIPDDIPNFIKTSIPAQALQIKNIILHHDNLVYAAQAAENVLPADASSLQGFCGLRLQAARAATGGLTDHAHLTSSESFQEKIQSAAFQTANAISVDIPDFIKKPNQVVQASKHGLLIDVSALQKLQLPTSEPIKESISDAAQVGSPFSGLLASLPSSTAPVSEGVVQQQEQQK